MGVRIKSDAEADKIIRYLFEVGKFLHWRSVEPDNPRLIKKGNEMLKKRILLKDNDLVYCEYCRQKHGYIDLNPELKPFIKLYQKNKDDLKVQGTPLLEKDSKGRITNRKLPSAFLNEVDDRCKDAGVDLKDIRMQ